MRIESMFNWQRLDFTLLTFIREWALNKMKRTKKKVLKEKSRTYWILGGLDEPQGYWLHGIRKQWNNVRVGKVIFELTGSINYTVSGRFVFFWGRKSYKCVYRPYGRHCAGVYRAITSFSIYIVHPWWFTIRPRRRVILFVIDATRRQKSACRHGQKEVLFVCVKNRNRQCAKRTNIPLSVPSPMHAGC